MRYRWYIWALALICFHQAFGGELEIKHLSQNWLFYDRYYQAYVPLIKKSQVQTSQHLWLTPSEYSGCFLRFTAKPGLTLLVNHQLIFRQADSTSVVRIPIKDLLPFAQSQKLGTILLTFFHERAWQPQEVSIVREVPQVESVSQSLLSDGLPVLPRSNTDLAAKVIFLFLLTFLLLTFMKNLYPRDFLFFWSLKREFLDEHLKPKILGASFWIIITCICLLASVSFFLLYHRVDTDLWILVKVMVAVFVAIGTKMIYNFILALVFGTVRTVGAEFLEFLRVVVLSMAFMGTALLLSYISIGFYLDLEITVFFGLLLAIMLITVVRMVLVQFNILNARNLHIISYICAAEILPLVVAAKVLLFR
ncbi:MAG: DUF4271 domain-containing protein [Cytophagaceae bacterium]|jgi:hypothetical protein|nr:DUF4271 domain-containing protein [Cytophagaceae bacterium]